MNQDELESLAAEIETLIFESGNCIKGSDLREILKRELASPVPEAQQSPTLTREKENKV